MARQFLSILFTIYRRRYFTRRRITSRYIPPHTTCQCRPTMSAVVLTSHCQPTLTNDNVGSCVTGADNVGRHCQPTLTADNVGPCVTGADNVGRRWGQNDGRHCQPTLTADNVGSCVADLNCTTPVSVAVSVSVPAVLHTIRSNSKRVRIWSVSNSTNAKRMNAGERSSSEERTVFESVALARSDHHHLLDNHFRLTGTFELDLNCASVRRTATFVPLAYTAVLHRVHLDTFSHLQYLGRNTCTPAVLHRVHLDTSSHL